MLRSSLQLASVRVNSTSALVYQYLTMTTYYRRQVHGGFELTLKVLANNRFLALLCSQVNAVETAIQMTIDLEDFRRIDDFAINTVVRPKYN